MRVKKADFITQWEYWPLLFVLAGFSLPLVVSWSYIGDFAKAREHGHESNIFIALAPILTGYVAIRITMFVAHRWRYGRATMHLQEPPIVLGGKLAGHLVVPQGVRADDLFCSRLKCYVQEVRPSNEETSIDFKVLWSAIHDVVPIQEPSDAGIILPVAFDVPPDLPKSGWLNDFDTVYWCLDVWIPHSFPRFRRTFTVEVEEAAAKKSAEPDITGRDDIECKTARGSEDHTRLATRGLQVRQLPGGGLDMLFKAPRSPRLVIDFGYFTLCLFLFGIALLFVPVHPFFPMAILVVAPVLLVTTLYFATWADRLQCLPGVLRYGEGMLGTIKMTSVAAVDIAGLDLFPAVEVTDFPAYHILLRTRQGQRVLIAKWLHSEEYAKLLVKVIYEKTLPNSDGWIDDNAIQE